MKLPWPLTSIEDETTRTILVKYQDHLTDHGFVSATKWTNGEGWTIEMDETSPFNLSTSQFTALKRAIRMLTQ